MQPSEREIYGPYWDGKLQVFGDPLAIERKLTHALDGDPDVALEAMRSPVEVERYEATEKVIKAVLFAFEGVPFDRKTGQGLNETECKELLYHYIDWRLLKKKSTGDLPSGQLATASVPSPSPTMSTSDCGCS